MKSKLLNNLCKIGLSSTILFGSLGSIQAQDISTSKTSIYFDNFSYTKDIEAKALNLLNTSKNHLDTTRTRNQLREKVGAIAELKKVKPFKKELNRNELVNHLRKTAVVFSSLYDCGNCDRAHMNAASGYILGEDGIIATNHHVVEGFAKSANGKNLAMAVSTFDGKVYLVTEILATDQASDLCIVKVDTRGDKLTPIALGNPAQQGDPIYVMSNPNQMLYYFTNGVVARNYMTPTSQRPNSKTLPNMDITADYAAGSSGAPVVDAFGSLVGTVSSTRSIYYNPKDQKNLQMVIKQTKPVILFEKLIKLI